MNKRGLPPLRARFAAFCLPALACSALSACARPGGDSAADAGVALSIEAVPAVRDEFAEIHGLHMHYARSGQGPTLVLLECGTCSVQKQWAAALPVFAKSYDVIAPDRMGHGKTPDDPTRAFDYHATAEDTVTLLGQLGVTRAMFVGWSDGANEALDIALNHPSLVAKLVTSGANYSFDGLPAEDLASMRLDAGVRASAADAGDAGDVSMSPLEARLRTLWTTEPTWTTEQLSKITAPTLIIAGDHDAIRLEHTVSLFQSIPRAELAILPGAGHGVVTQNAPLWDRTVLTFLSKSTKAPP